MMVDSKVVMSLIAGFVHQPRAAQSGGSEGASTRRPFARFRLRQTPHAQWTGSLASFQQLVTYFPISFVL